MNRNLKAHFKNFVVFNFLVMNRQFSALLKLSSIKHENVAVKEQRLSKL